jgi:hypothetical protein
LYEIADLFEENHIKRVPIVGKDVDLVGIVSRAKHHSGHRKRPAEARNKPPRRGDP